MSNRAICTTGSILRRFEPPSPPVEFGTIEVEDSAIGADYVDRVLHRDFRPPNWLLDMMQSGAPPRDIVATLQERVLSGDSDLHEAQLILNDIGRRWGGASILKEFVTQGIITRLGG